LTSNHLLPDRVVICVEGDLGSEQLILDLSYQVCFVCFKFILDAASSDQRKNFLGQSYDTVNVRSDVNSLSHTLVKFLGELGTSIVSVGAGVLWVEVDLEDAVLDAAAAVGKGAVGIEGDLALGHQLVERLLKVST
jgi:hypothetical protein